jgi:Pretoxin HINT domain
VQIQRSTLPVAGSSWGWCCRLRTQGIDPRDGITTDKVVTTLHNNHDTDLADLTVVDDSGARAIIHTTQNHPFWDVTSHKWTEAGKLRPGDQLRSSTTITSTSWRFYH